MTNRKFYKAIFQVEVLSEEPIGEPTLNQLHYMITDGGCSGDFKKISEDEIDGKQAADALKAQASDPEFFRIDDEGEDAE